MYCKPSKRTSAFGLLQVLTAMLTTGLLQLRPETAHSKEPVSQLSRSRVETPGAEILQALVVSTCRRCAGHSTSPGQIFLQPTLPDKVPNCDPKLDT